MTRRATSATRPPSSRCGSTRTCGRAKKTAPGAAVDTVLGGLRTGCGLSSATRGSEEWDAETCRNRLGNPGPAKGGQVGPGALQLGLRMKGVLASCSSRAVEFYGWIGALVQKE